MGKAKANGSVEQSQSITVLEEIADLKPTEKEVRLYAKGLGIDPDRETYLLPIAREGVSASLPSGWLALKSSDGSIFYQQKRTGIIVWEHPLDAQFRAKVAEARKKKLNSLNTEPIESRTVYQQLPEPKPSKSSENPPVHKDNTSGSGSITTHSSSNMPHVDSSPTQHQSALPQKVLAERNVISKSRVSIPHRSIRRTSGDENVDPSIDQLADRLRSDVCVSENKSSSLRQPRQEVSRPVRKLFEEEHDACASSLFSPLESPDRRYHHALISPRTPEYRSRSERRGSVLTVSPIDELFASEFDRNISLRYLLEEQRRLHDKIVVLKATYKAYKARLASINFSISILQSGRAAAVVAATTAEASPASAVSHVIPGNYTQLSPRHHRCRSQSSVPHRQSGAGTTSPTALTASELHYHQQRKVHQRPGGDDRDRRFSIQSVVSKRAPRSII
ncbi:hypothetical protein Aperf_G00000117899 [Anoplocephala perfoliata]